MSKAQIKTLESFLRLQQNLASFHVMKVAARLGILAELQKGQKTALELAKSLSLNPERTEWLMLALSETEICELHGDDYALTQAARMLPPNMTLGDQHWHDLENFITDKSNTLPSSVDEALNDAHLVSMQPWMQTPAAMDAAELLDMGKSRRGLKILEVGGGSAIFGSAIAHRDPDSQIVVLEHPAHVEQATATVTSIGLESRFQIYEYVDQDNTPLPDAQFDLILIVGQMHGTPVDRGPAMLQRLVTTLKPGGELAIIDWFPGQPAGMRTLKFYQLELALRQTRQSFHSPQMVRDWVMQAGLENIQFAHLPSPPHIWGLLLAQRPAEG